MKNNKFGAAELAYVDYQQKSRENIETARRFLLDNDIENCTRDAFINIVNAHDDNDYYSDVASTSSHYFRSLDFIQTVREKRGDLADVKKGDKPSFYKQFDSSKLDRGQIWAIQNGHDMKTLERCRAFVTNLCKLDDACCKSENPQWITRSVTPRYSFRHEEGKGYIKEPIYQLLVTKEIEALADKVAAEYHDVFPLIETGYWELRPSGNASLRVGQLGYITFLQFGRAKVFLFDSYRPRKKRTTKPKHHKRHEHNAMRNQPRLVERSRL